MRNNVYLSAEQARAVTANKYQYAERKHKEAVAQELEVIMNRIHMFAQEGYTQVFTDSGRIFKENASELTALGYSVSESPAPGGWNMAGPSTVISWEK